MTASYVAIVANSYAGGGAERSSLLTAVHWPEAGDVVFVTCRATGPYATTVPETLLTDEIGVQPKPLQFLRFARGLRSVTSSRPIRVVILNGYGLNQAVLLSQAFGLSQRTRVVVVERNTLSLKLLHRFQTRIVRLAVIYLTRHLYRRADAIVGISDGVSRDLERTLGLPSQSVATIYNPVDTEHITRALDSPIPEELERAFAALPRPVVLTTGRLVPQKAHQDLLDAFAQLPEGQRGSLVILGEGPLREDLERQAQRLGISDRVWMPGFVDNPWWFIARSDVFALSSHWEGFGRVLVEALACSVPVVSTDCPSGPREILEGIPGTRLTPVRDTTALSEAISDLLRDRNRVDMSQIDLSPYEPSHVAAQYAAVVNALPTR